MHGQRYRDARPLQTLLIASIALPLSAHASGWACEAAGSWSSCPDGETRPCASHGVEARDTRAERVLAEAGAVEACRTRMSAERLSNTWHATASAPDATTRVDRPCAITTCAEAPEFTEDPLLDAFDDPVCVGVRRYVCDLCGQSSPLCTRVQRERPVTALGCADTWVELEAFVGVLEQFDTLQPGSMRDAVAELCGTAPPTPDPSEASAPRDIPDTRDP